MDDYLYLRFKKSIENEVSILGIVYLYSIYCLEKIMHLNLLELDKRPIFPMLIFF